MQLVPFQTAAADESSLGSAMRALNDRQRRFVLALVTCANNPTEAARLAAVDAIAQANGASQLGPWGKAVKVGSWPAVIFFGLVTVWRLKGWL